MCLDADRKAFEKKRDRSRRRGGGGILACAVLRLQRHNSHLSALLPTEQTKRPVSFLRRRMLSGFGNLVGRGWRLDGVFHSH